MDAAELQGYIVYLGIRNEERANGALGVSPGQYIEMLKEEEDSQLPLDL